MRSMDVAEARGAVTNVTGVAPRSVRPVPGGWASFTFEIDGRYIVRFPRNAQVARCTQAELELLPRLGPAVDFAVPEVRWHGTHRGFPFFMYEAIPGQPLTREHLEANVGLVPALAAALRQLHDLDLRALSARPGTTGARPHAGLGPSDAWRARHAELRRSSDRLVAPLLRPAVASRLDDAWDDFQAQLEFCPSLVHADLGLEHLLVAADRLTGIIDWETAGPGDPAIDFVGLHIGLGPTWTRRILAAYGPAGSGLPARVAHYAWIGAVHAVLYGLEEDRSDIVAEGCRGLESRLGSLDLS